MNNGLIFVVTAIVELTFILFMLRFGKTALYALIVANIILVSTFGSQLIAVFGLVTNAGNVYYASIFVATNILTEHFGRKEGFRSVFIGFAALVMFVLMSQFAVRLLPVSSDAVTLAIKTLFTGVPRVALASMSAYLLAQNFNVWLFAKLHRQDGPKGLWLRNIVSSLLGQMIDSLVFFSIAFAGLVSSGVLIQTILIGFGLKAVIAIASTPILYLSYPMLEGVDVD